MNVSSALDLVIALGGVYFLLSLVSSAFLEMWAGNRRLRARFLDQAITGMFSNDTVALGKFYNHSLIKSLVQDPSSGRPSADKPPYIPSDVFASVLLDLTPNLPKQSLDALSPTPPVLGPDSPKQLRDYSKRLAADAPEPPLPSWLAPPILGDSLEQLRNDAGRLSANELSQALSALIGPLNADTVENARKNIADWFDVTMERTNGWYKRYSKKRLFWIAVVLAVLFNVDTFDLASTLISKPNLLAKTAEAVSNVLVSPSVEIALTLPDDKAPDNPATVARDEALLDALANLQDSLDSADLPWGWQSKQISELWDRRGQCGFFIWRITVKVAGLYVTVIAVSFGAPFWFDLLNKVSNMRSAGQVPLTELEKKLQSA